MFLLEVVFLMLIPFCIAQVVVVRNTIYLRLIYALFLITLFLLAAFRVTSPDYSNYVTYFKLLSTGFDYRDTNIVAADPAFAYLNYSLAYFTKEPISVFLFFSFSSVAINFICYKKYSPFFFLCVLFYISHTYVAREMMQIRAGLACALCLYSIRYILRKKIILFCITVLIASAIHLGACVFLLAYFIGNFDISRKRIFIILVIAFGIGVLSPFGNIFKQLPSMEFLQRVQYYNSSQYGESAGVFTNLIILKGLLIIAFCLYFHNSLINLNKYYLISFNLYFFSVVWYLVWNDFEILAARIATFFSITEVLLLSYIPLLMKTNKDKILGSILLVLVAIAILTLNITTGKWNDVILPWAL